MAEEIAQLVEAHCNDDTNSVVRWILGAVSILPATPGTVINDETFFKSGRVDNTTSISIARNPGASDDLAALCFVYTDGSQAPTGITWNSVALTKLLEKAEGVWTLSIWLLAAADSGSHNFDLTWASAVDGYAAAVILKDVDGTTPTGGSNSKSESAANAAITMTVKGQGTLTDGVLFQAMGCNINLVDMNIDSGGEVTGIHVTSGPEALELDADFQIIDTVPTPEPEPTKFDEPPGGGGPLGVGGEPGAGDPGVGEARRPRVPSLRGKRGRRGFKAGPPGTRGKLPPVQGEQIDKRIPDEYKEPLVRKWLDFGWLVRPMLEGQKTITLRDWGTIEGVQWQHGELFFAYDGDPVEGGRRLALCRVMQVPFEDFTAGLTMADYHKLGFSYAMANQLTAPSGRTALEIWEDLIVNPRRLWLLRFKVERIFEQGRKEQDTVNVGVPRRI